MYCEHDALAAIVKIKNAVHAIHSDASQVSTVLYDFNAGYGSAGKELQQVLKRERIPIGQLNAQTCGGIDDGVPLAQLSGRPAVGFPERIIESPCTPKAGCGRAISHG